MVLLSNNTERVVTVLRKVLSPLLEEPPLTRKDELVQAQQYCLHGIDFPVAGNDPLLIQDTLRFSKPDINCKQLKMQDAFKKMHRQIENRWKHLSCGFSVKFVTGV